MAKLPMPLLLAITIVAGSMPSSMPGTASPAPGTAGRITASKVTAGKVTIAQLEQLLPALRSERDAKAARALAALQLIERVTPDRLARWQSGFSGERSRQALLALADASAFLDLPPAKISSNPPPGIETQRQIFSRTVIYVNKTLRKLPNFSALRTTTRFEVATPQQLTAETEVKGIYQMDPRMPSFHALGRVKLASSYPTQLYFAGTFDRVVTYRDGKEVADVQSKKGEHSEPPFGLSTQGEFGPILYVVLGDAIKGTVLWSHWEQATRGSTALLAVFHYEVPKDVSHYELESVADNQSNHPAYQGEITVDPATGAIFRITIQSAPNPSAWLASSALALEFGPVVIGGSTYICPIRGVAVSQARYSNRQAGSDPSAPLQSYLNDVSFTQYHLFRAETRILPAGDSTH